MGQPSQKVPSWPGLLGEATSGSSTLDTWGPRERRLLEATGACVPCSQSLGARPVWGTALAQASSPQPAAAETALPSPTSCVRPVWLWPPSAGCEHAPAPPTPGEWQGRALSAQGRADPSGICPCQLRCPRLLCWLPGCPGKPNPPEAPGSPWPAA